MGTQVSDVLDASASASLGDICAMVAIGLMCSKNSVLQVDVEAACLHADVVGPPYYLEIPRVALPATWAASSSVRRPVLLLHKAIPGLQQSGAFWHDLADRVLRHHGWKPIEDVAEDVYFKDDAHKNLLVLALYVDDWIFGGPSDSVCEDVRRRPTPRRKSEPSTSVPWASRPLPRRIPACPPMDRPPAHRVHGATRVHRCPRG